MCFSRYPRQYAIHTSYDEYGVSSCTRVATVSLFWLTGTARNLIIIMMELLYYMHTAHTEHSILISVMANGLFLILLPAI